MLTFLLVVKCCHLASVVLDPYHPHCCQGAQFPNDMANCPTRQRTDTDELLNSAAVSITRALEKQIISEPCRGT